MSIQQPAAPYQSHENSTPPSVWPTMVDDTSGIVASFDGLILDSNADIWKERRMQKQKKNQGWFRHSMGNHFFITVYEYIVPHVTHNHSVTYGHHILLHHKGYNDMILHTIVHHHGLPPQQQQEGLTIESCYTTFQRSV